MHPNPFGLAHSLSPVDLPEPLIPPPHPLRWTSTVIAVAALALFLLNAHAIRGWAWQLPPGPWSERAVIVAERWYEAVGRLGLNRPVEAMHDEWQSLKDRRFSSSPSPGDGEGTHPQLSGSPCPPDLAEQCGALLTRSRGGV